MYMTNNVIQELDYILKRYPCHLHKEDEEDILRVYKNKIKLNSPLHLLTRPEHDFETITNLTYKFINSGYSDTTILKSLYDIMYSHIIETKIHLDYNISPKSYLPVAFTFCFIMLKIFHARFGHIRLVATIETHLSRYYILANNKKFYFSKSNIVSFRLHQNLFDNFRRSDDTSHPKGYIWQFDTEDLTQLEYLINSYKNSN